MAYYGITADCWQIIGDGAEWGTIGGKMGIFTGEKWGYFKGSPPGAIPSLMISMG